MAAWVTPPMPMRFKGTQPLVGAVSVERQTMVPAAMPAALPAGARTASWARVTRLLSQVLVSSSLVLAIPT